MWSTAATVLMVASRHAPVGNAQNATVLVVGDSWGALGPSWHELQDMFDRHKINVSLGNQVECQQERARCTWTPCCRSASTAPATLTHAVLAVGLHGTVECASVGHGTMTTTCMLTPNTCIYSTALSASLTLHRWNMSRSPPPLLSCSLGDCSVCCCKWVHSMPVGR